MDSDDLLLEILLRLSPQPSSLPRASLVCKRWRRLVTDPIFLDRFRARHGKPPILGVFFNLFGGKPSFSPTLDPPDSIPPERFSLRLEGDAWCFHGCRHGRVLLTKSVYGDIQPVLVWDPVTGDQRFLGVPRALSVVSSRVAAAVVCSCTVRGKGHVHGGGCPFKVVLVRDDVLHGRLLAHVYSSETGAWGNLILASAESPSAFNPRNIMVGNSLYWFVFARELSIVGFDFDTESFAHIEVEAPVKLDHNGIFLSTLIKSGGFGFIVMLGFTVQTWERTVDRGGVTRWLQGQTIELDNIFAARTTGWTCRKVLWIDGDHNVMFVLANNNGVFMVQLESMQYKRIFEDSPFSKSAVPNIHPFTSFYAAGSAVIEH